VVLDYLRRVMAGFTVASLIVDRRIVVVRLDAVVSPEVCRNASSRGAR
jgi:hypothetical protein